MKERRKDVRIDPLNKSPIVLYNLVIYKGRVFFFGG
jgi:hypothetical protein